MKVSEFDLISTFRQSVCWNSSSRQTTVLNVMILIEVLFWKFVDLMGLAELFILCWSDIVNVFCFFLQDHVTDLLTTMDASQVHFDIVSSLSFSTSNIRLGIVNYKQFIQKLWAPWAYLKSMVSWNNRLSQTVLTIVMLYCQNQGH